MEKPFPSLLTRAVHRMLTLPSKPSKNPFHAPSPTLETLHQLQVTISQDMLDASLHVSQVRRVDGRHHLCCSQFEWMLCSWTVLQDGLHMAGVTQEGQAVCPHAYPPLWAAVQSGAAMEGAPARCPAPVHPGEG